jgi:hypothetical protein
VKGGRLVKSRVKIFVFDVTQSSDDISKPFVGRLLDAGIECEVEVIPLSSPDVPFQTESRSHQPIICLTYTSVGAWKDYSATREFKNCLRSVAKLTVTSFNIFMRHT